MTTLPPLPADDAYTADLSFLAQLAMGGFVYHGDRLEAVIATVKALRADPELARRLLEVNV